MKLLSVILVMTLSIEVLAEVCTPPAIRRVPVIDQDGIGTCASASSAVLLQLNVENEDGRQGLPKQPSYLQMSIYSAARNSEPGFFKNEPGGRRTFFNGYQNVCPVIDTAMNQGFCDSEKFPLDFVNEDDVFNSQQKSLEMIGNYLQGNLPALEQFRSSLRDDPQKTKDLLAFLYQKQANACRGNPRDTIVKNVWLRRKAAWREQLNRTTDPARRRVLTELLNRTFGPDGQPTAAAMAFGQDDLFEKGFAAVTTPDRVATIGEGLLSVHWAIRLDLGQHAFLTEGVTDDGIQQDHRRTQYCEWPMLMAMQEYIQNPDCPVPRDISIPQDIRNSVEAVTRMVSRQDLRASIVGLMSPACADQAARRRVTGYRCQETVVNPSNVGAKKYELFSELCASRAVSLTICRNITRLTGPFNSENCTKTIPGGGGYDYHAISAIGFRSNGGKRQVLIQNSAGGRCDFADGNATRAGFAGTVECEVGTNGVTTGRFWIDEDFLMNNTAAMVVLNKI